MAELRFGTAASADMLLRQALREQLDIGDRWGPTWSVEGMAWIAAALNQPEAAAAVSTPASPLPDTDHTTTETTETNQEGTAA